MSLDCLNLKGVIVGKALYEKRFSLREAIALTKNLKGGNMRINKAIVLVSTVLFLAGCATVSRQELDEEIQDLRRQMSSLSTQAQQKMNRSRL